VELFTLGLSHPAVVERAAARAEAAGWDGMLVVDSQNLAGDPFVGLALAARATTSLRLGTGVTNPATRHPAATAAAIASVHAASGGRAVLGIGRGDSALAHLGLAPVGVGRLRDYVATVRAYLAGEPVPFDQLSTHHQPGARPIADLGLADAPDTSRLHWLDASLPPVPVEVAATGPRVLDVAARGGDRVLLAVGADPARVGWAVDRVRAVDADVPIGAFVNVAVHDDLTTARSLAGGSTASFARFSAMDGRVRTPIDAAGAEVLDRVHGAYDMNAHTRAGSPQAAALSAEFVDRFAVVGPPGTCIERLRALAALGIDRFVVVGPAVDADPDAARRARRAFVTDVMPELRIA
jgi:5,10-methylenetetrahydromethanopterin reductase